MSLRPSAFISYSHQDGADFTHRLVFGLSMYMDVFFDIHLQAGDYPKQLFKEIEKRDHFLFVMTPYSIKSKWCRDELEYAEKCGKSITLAMVFDSELVQRHELTERYSYGPFHLDYEAGFRRVTELMLGKATSSWEGFINLEKDEIIEALRQGLVPGIIAKEFVEWLMVEKLWAKLEKYIQRVNDNKYPVIMRGVPRTSVGVLRQARLVKDQYARNNDVMGHRIAEQLVDSFEPLIQTIVSMNDKSHAECGEVAYKVYEAAKKELTLIALTETAEALFYIGKGGYFDFDVSEKLKELILVHARRSRYLY